MTAKSNRSPIADLHTPEELLDNAETLFASHNPKLMRAAILEAITALESYVQEKVFAGLETKIDAQLAKWLEEKTRMDFDTRLAILTPVAIGIQVDKQSSLWNSYKTAKEIRNTITHSGKKVSETDARFVIDTVYEWLAYLGGTLSLELALSEFKRYVEANVVGIQSEAQATALVRDYFMNSPAAKSAASLLTLLDDDPRVKTDVAIKLGEYHVFVETKFGQFSINHIDQAVEQTQAITYALRNKGVFFQNAIIYFTWNRIPDSFNAIQIRNKGQTYLAVIKVQRLSSSAGYTA
jgi:hypothetical protein